MGGERVLTAPVQDTTSRLIALRLTGSATHPQVVDALLDLPEPEDWATVRGEGRTTAFVAAGALEWVLDAEPALEGGIELRRRVRPR